MSALLQKRIENGRRRQREALLAACEDTMVRAISEMPYDAGPEADAQIASWPWPPDVEGAPKPAGVPDTWTYQIFDDWLAARCAVSALKLTTGAGFLWLGPELPLFSMDCGRWAELASALLNELPKRPDSRMAVVAADKTSGLILGEYVGTLESGDQTGERVYELTHW